MSRRGRAAVALPAGDDHGRSCAVEPGNGRGEETARGDTGGGGLGGDAQTRSEGCGLQRRKTRPGVWIGLGLRSAKKIFGPNQRVVPGLPGLPAGSATVNKRVLKKLSYLCEGLETKRLIKKMIHIPLYLCLY